MYQIVYSEKQTFLSEAVEEVEAEVKKLKSQGWVEQGGVSISSSLETNNLYIYYVVAQAMVKKEE